ncbi:hypothetical protein RD110_17535 [Rhodoferax koreense]|uniref:Uncharacterized protein n=1 Tax=Rhodoferax koreensis TaxID=1842727 RepID=A0A1P8JYG7_9BURK|nr:hypothetical protein [Rhodoferax koreense]APW38785.1 hypothetical protein RD110_17535 [Rhodoferax koreense]
MHRCLRFLVQALKGFGTAVFALLLIFEEWGWDPLSRLLYRMARLPVWSQIEKLIVRLPPYAALAVFGVPVLALIPVKLLAWYWVAQGHALLGLSVVVAAKVAGTAIAARLFQLTQPALMQLPWFNRGYGRFKTWKDDITARVRQSPIWRKARCGSHRLRRYGRTRGRLAWQGLRNIFSR